MDYSRLMKELGFVRSSDHSRVEFAADVDRLGKTLAKPSALAKALGSFNRKMVKSTGVVRSAVAANDLATRRARCAELNRQATALAESGQITAEQGAQIDVLLHKYARENCQ